MEPAGIWLSWSKTGFSEAVRTWIFLEDMRFWNLLTPKQNYWAVKARVGGDRTVADRAAVLFAVEQVGLADAAMIRREITPWVVTPLVVPIASYQAIKHKLANMYVKNTLARSNCYYGAWALNTDSAELPLAAATARVGAIKAAVFAAEENVQTPRRHGFTWEFDCQFYYRRAKLLGVNVGSEEYWQDRLITAYEAKQRCLKPNCTR